MKKVLLTAFLGLQLGSAFAGDNLQAAKSGNEANGVVSTEAGKRANEVIPELGDYDFAWDQFKHRGRMIWACRGVRTGQVVDSNLCAGKDMVDSHWPDKNISPNWKE